MSSKRWTEQEISKLKELATVMSSGSIAKILGRSKESVVIKCSRLGIQLETTPSRRWLQEDDDLLKEVWDKYTVDEIAKKLNRTIDGIKIRARKLNLPPATDRTYKIRLTSFSKITGISRARLTRMEKRLNFPIDFVKTQGNRGIYAIDWEKFLAWLKNNKSEVDASKFDRLICPRIPKWLQEKIDLDRIDKSNLQEYLLTKSWTEQDIAILENYVSTGKSYEETAKRLGRSVEAIEIKVIRLKLTYQSGRYWSSQEVLFLRDSYKNMTTKEIAEKLGRTTKAVQEKCRKLGYRKRG